VTLQKYPELSFPGCRNTIGGTGSGWSHIAQNKTRLTTSKITGCGSVFQRN